VTIGPGGQVPLTGPRAIDEDATVLAFQLLDRAQIDVSKKAIWADRSRILSGVKNTLLADWLRQRAG
jgi:hypothetical protein